MNSILPSPAYSLETLSEAHQYNRFVVERMHPFLGTRLLELGTGIGNLTPLFLENGREVTAIDIDDNLLQVHRQRVRASGALRVECVSLQEVARRPAEKSRYDAVVSSNVLEHIDDNAIKEVVEAMHVVLKPGGHAVHWVPAMQGIFGSLDTAFGHFRRYDKTSAAALFQGSAFRVLSCSYWNMIGSLGWWFAGTVLRREAIPRSSALFFDRFLMPLIRVIEPVVWRPFGQSLLIVAQKVS